MDAFSLIAKISLDSSEYDSGLSSAGSKLSSFGTALKTGIGTAAKIGTAAIAAVGTAVVGSSVAFIKGAGDIAEYGDNIDKMSQKMGISAQGYQEWEAVMQHSGTSMESLKAGMKTLANAVENGNDAFGRLGITQEQIASMSNEELFNTTISALQNVENETERTYLAGQLLGRGATELGALLNTSAEDTQAMKDKVHELGGVLSDEAVKAAAKYQDTLQDMQTAFNGLKMGLMSDFLPSITMVMEGLTDLFTGNGGLDKIQQGITDFTSKFTEALPQVLEVGAEIVNSLMAAIMENLPQLVEAGTTAVTTLATGLVENAGIIGDSLLQLMSSAAEQLTTFDWAGTATQIANGLTNAFSGEGASQFISTASTILSGIVSGIGESLPILIPAAVEIVSQLVSDLAEQVPMLMEAATVLITGLIDGIYNGDAITSFTEAGIQLALALGEGLGTQGPVIISKLVTAIASNAPQLFVLGPTIIAAFIIGLVGALGQLVEPAIQIITQLVSNITAQFSKIVTAGQQLLKSFIDGIKAKFGELASTAKNIVETVKKAITEKIKEAKQWGADLMNNFINGIKEKIASLKAMVSEVAGSVKSVLGHSHPETGPMADDYTWMPDMMKMFAEGIRDNTDLVTDQLKKSFDIGDIVTSPFANATTNTNPNTEIVNLLTQIRDKGNVVIIEGDAARMFRVMQSESRKYHQTTGREAFA